MINLSKSHRNKTGKNKEKDKRKLKVSLDTITSIQCLNNKNKVKITEKTTQGTIIQNLRGRKHQSPRN